MEQQEGSDHVWVLRWYKDPEEEGAGEGGLRAGRAFWAYWRSSDLFVGIMKSC